MMFDFVFRARVRLAPIQRAHSFALRNFRYSLQPFVCVTGPGANVAIAQKIPSSYFVARCISSLTNVTYSTDISLSIGNILVCIKLLITYISFHTFSSAVRKAFRAFRSPSHSLSCNEAMLVPYQVQSVIEQKRTKKLLGSSFMCESL